jgi:hypothetical protein
MVQHLGFRAMVWQYAHSLAQGSCTQYLGAWSFGTDLSLGVCSLGLSKSKMYNIMNLWRLCSNCDSFYSIFDEIFQVILISPLYPPVSYVNLGLNLEIFRPEYPFKLGMVLTKNITLRTHTKPLMSKTPSI